MAVEKWIIKAKNTGKNIVFAIGLILVATGCGSMEPAEPAGTSGIRSQQAETSDDSIEQTDISQDSSEGMELTERDYNNAEQSSQNEEDFVNIEQAGRIEAVYLGVNHYGAEETNKENKDNFQYRFEIDGREEVLAIDNGTKDEEGNFDYPIQNVLKEGYSYEIKVENGVVTEAVELLKGDNNAYEPPVTGTPGEHTLKNFLATALEPVGTTLYIYGGGWNWQDNGSSIQATTIGISPDWVRFFIEQDEDFTYRDKDGGFYPYGGFNEYYYAGLDCSGYLGWVVYNTLNDKSGGEGYVGSSTGFAKRLADMGFGDWTQNVVVPDGSSETAVKPGDIVSIKGHVWISLGTCADGSVVILHSTPSDSRTGQSGGGVQIGAIGKTLNCEAYQLADFYMSEYYPEWYRRYAVSLKKPETYFEIKGDTAGRFTWDVMGEESVLTDPEEFQKLSPEEVLSELFAE